MFDATRHGERAHRFAPKPFGRSILRRIVLGCALLVMGLWLPGALAASLYRCVGVSGEAVYSSTTTGYHQCKKIGSYADAAPRKISAPVRVASLTRVQADVTTSARSLASDGASPVSLEHVQGAVVATHPLSTAVVQRVSLARVSSAVETTGRTPAIPEVAATAATAASGQWVYHESRGDSAPPSVAAPASARVLRGAVYRVAKSDGSVEYTNLRPAGTKSQAVTMLFSYIATCVACDLHSPIRWGRVRLNLTAYAEVIHAASAEYGVDEAFLRAIIHAESAFNPRALSLKGAQGLMQLMPGTANDMGVLDAFNVDQNIRGGARYLSLMLKNFHGDERLAAAAYNAGPGAVQRYNGVPPYAETQVYVERVGTLRKRYDAAIQPPLAASSPLAANRSR
ncbi:MAG: lytic transglycosylase domain-containing protein [Rhodanobacter sp.]